MRLALDQTDDLRVVAAPPARPRVAARPQFALTVVAIAGVLALFAPGAPTGTAFVDAALRGVVALAIVVAAMQGSALARFIAAGATAVVVVLHPTSLSVVAAGGAFAIATGDALSDADGFLTPALVGCGISGAALRFGTGGPLGTTSLAALVVFALLAFSAYANCSAVVRRRVLLAAAAVGGAIVIATLLLIAAAGTARHHLDEGLSQTRAALDASRRGDTDAAAVAFDEARKSFARADHLVESPLTQPARLVPIVAQYRHALVEVTRSGVDLTGAGSAVVRSGNPSVTLQHSAVSIPALRALQPPLETAYAALRRSAHRLKSIDRTWLATPLTHQLDAFDARIARGLHDTQTGLSAARVLPAIFGADGTRRYFVAFQTPAEERASGGIIGNYAVVSFDHGHFDLAQRGRDTDLNEQGSTDRGLSGPRDYVRRYSQFDPAHTWQNVTMSPDGPSVAQVIEQLAPQSGAGNVDGVITIDPKGIAALLQLTGPVHVDNVPFALTAENAEQFFLRDQYTMFASNGVRIDVLGNAIDAIITRLKAVDLPAPGRIAAALGPIVREGRLTLHSVQPDEEALFARLDATGSFPAVRSDFVGLVTQNASGNKIDVFERRAVHYDATVDPETGQMHATATITLHNDAPRAGLPAIVINGSGPNPTGAGESRIYVSFYTPLALTGATVNQVAQSIDGTAELGRNVYSTTVLVPAGGTATIRLKLAGHVVLPNGSYQLTLWRQPTVRPDGVELTVRTNQGRTLVRTGGQPKVTTTYEGRP
jgi:hypothetical protein